MMAVLKGTKIQEEKHRTKIREGSYAINMFAINELNKKQLNVANIETVTQG